MIKEEFEQVEYIEELEIEEKGEKEPVRKKRLRYKIDQFGVVLEVEEVD